MRRADTWFFTLLIVGVLAAIVWFTVLSASSPLAVPSGQPPVGEMGR